MPGCSIRSGCCSIRRAGSNRVHVYNDSMENTSAKTYVRLDEHGVMRVGNARAMLDGIVYSFLEGHTPETIREQYPSLDLEQVYGAITYYLANREQVHQYLDRQQNKWNELTRESDEIPSPVVERLRALRAGAQPSWFDRVAGSFKDDPEFDDILRLGRDIRQTDRLVDE